MRMKIHIKVRVHSDDRASELAEIKSVLMRLIGHSDPGYGKKP